MTGRNVSAPRILVTLSTYLPGFRSGGPLRTVANMVDQLGDEFQFYVIAADRDVGDREAYTGITPETWTPVGKALVFYRRPGLLGWRAAMKAARALNFDLLYLNSFFGTPTLVPLLYRRLGWTADRPVLLAPRGEFAAGALAIKSGKKRTFMAVARTLGFYRKATFNASSVHESADIRAAMGGVNIMVASNLAPRGGAPGTPRERPPGTHLKAVFLSRVSRMKNLAGAIEILGQVSCPVDFDIYGVVDDPAYWDRCRDLLLHLPQHVRARFRGEVAPDRVDDVLSDYDFLLLPTLGENYGHVIREALSAGLPVLISDRTPWRNLAERGAGADLPLDDQHAFVKWIEHLDRLAHEPRQSMREAARQVGSDPDSAARDLKATRDMLHAAIAGQPG